MLFKELGLSPKVLIGVTDSGYTIPTPIQEKAIPVVLQGRDLLAKAQTGTGKTAAFTLPVLDILSKQDAQSNAPRAIIITPTRELASQVHKSVYTYGKAVKLRSTVVVGGTSTSMQKQKLRKGVDLVIGTPGRLLDLINQRALDLSKIEILVLDEADRMLDMGFINDIREIMSSVPSKRQVLFFSATYSRKVQDLANSILHNPKTIEIASKNVAADTVEQFVYYMGKTRKFDLLVHLLAQEGEKQVLVFTKTKNGANKLTQALYKERIRAIAMHSDKSQAARIKALADFKNNKVRVLVATDVASRGIDINQLSLVINYDVPQFAEDYVHRIGRTGRAGTAGKTILFAAKEDGKYVRSIERLTKKTIAVLNLKEPIVQTSHEEHVPQKRSFQRRPKREGYTRREGGKRG